MGPLLHIHNDKPAAAKNFGMANSVDADKPVNVLGQAIFAICLLLAFVTNAGAMPNAQTVADDFQQLAELLPCQQHIDGSAQTLGYSQQAQTQIDTDYAEIEYERPDEQARLTLAQEITPIGAQYSIILDISQTDQTYADTIVTALRRNWDLPESVPVQNLARGTARHWTLDLTNGVTQITVHQNAKTTNIIGILAPLRPGTSLPC